MSEIIVFSASLPVEVNAAEIGYSTKLRNVTASHHRNSDMCCQGTFLLRVLITSLRRVLHDCLHIHVQGLWSSGILASGMRFHAFFQQHAHDLNLREGKSGNLT